MRTTATRQLGIELPLVAPASKDASFCAGVCEAGGLGVLDGRAARLDEALQAVSSLTGRPFALDLTMPDVDWQGAGKLMPDARRAIILATMEGWRRFGRRMGADAICLLRLDRIGDAADAKAAGAGGLVLTLPEPGTRGASWREALHSAASRAPGLPLIASARFEDGAQMRSALAWGAGAVQSVVDPGAATPVWLGETVNRLKGERHGSGPAVAAGQARSERASREAAALRANLRRRKAQSRARDEHE